MPLFQESRKILSMKSLLVGALFIHSAIAGHLTTTSFLLCLQKRATGFAVRTLRLHYFPEENLHALIYTQQGREEIKCRGRWRRVCMKAFNRIKVDLEKGLWKCEDFSPVKVFYPQLLRHDES